MICERSEATNQQTGDVKIQILDKADTSSNLKDPDVSAECPALSKDVAKKEQSVIVKAATVKDVIAGIPKLMENSLTAITAPGSENCERYGDS